MDTIESLKNEIERLKAKIEILEEQNRQLVSGKYWESERNERNAGRKPKITNEIIQMVNQYKLKGLTFREIAEKMNISVGLAHKAYRS